MTRISVRSAADLFEALESSDLGLRLAALKVVCEQPGRAAAYGRHGKRDVIDVLVQMDVTVLPAALQRLLVAAISAYRDPRVPGWLIGEFQRSSDRAVLQSIARRFAEEPPVEACRFFGPWAMQDHDLVRARAAARALAGNPELSEGERIRVASALAAEGCEVPTVTAANSEQWLRELCGPYWVEARHLVERSGAEAFRALRAYWPAFDDRTAEWFLKWGVRDHPLESVELLKPLLESGEGPRSLLALQMVPRLGAAAALFAPVVQRFIDHADPAYRLAAIRAGASGDWERLVAEDSAPEVRAAALRRSAELADRAVPAIRGGLSDPDWQVRAAATEALKQLGEEGVRLAKELMACESRDARLAAMQVLVAAGEYAWLENHAVE